MEITIHPSRPAIAKTRNGKRPSTYRAERALWPSEAARPKPPRDPICGIGELSYPFHDRTVLVSYCGRICIFKKKVNLSTSLAGQAVGINEVDDGIWLVSFMDYDLGYIDLEEKTLQPLNNPFGPKVLPMS